MPEPSIPGSGQPPLTFTVVEGHTQNYFWRSHEGAAHLVLDPRGRIIMALPAGNEGVALWFAGGPVTVEGDLSEVGPGPRGTHGASVVLRLKRPLKVTRVLLGSVRMIRRRLQGEPLPPQMTRVSCEPQNGGLVLRRQMLHGQPLELQVEPLDQTRLQHSAGDQGFSMEGQGASRVRLTVLTRTPPLTPVPMDQLLRRGCHRPTGALADLRALAFLTYEEKLLAGSWRFLSYFGRDTLLWLRLLCGALAPRVIELALSSVLRRLGPGGEVAHEEALGEWAVFERGARSPGGGEPEQGEQLHLDHNMVDDDFLLAPVAAHYLLDDPQGPARARAFLASRTAAGESHEQLLRRNLELVMRLAEPFAAEPRWTNLIHLGPGRWAGNWRDSDQGLGGGRCPWDVNVVLVPAALAAASRLYESWRQPVPAARALRLERAWSAARGRFQVQLSAELAARRIRRYAATQGLDPAPALASLQGPLRYDALALDHQGRPLEVMHSDHGFELLFARPTPPQLERAARLLLRPFPAGLRSPVGLLVANPALAADTELQQRFSRDHYHGAVVWSWQQAMLAAGLAHQLRRRDLPPATAELLGRAHQVVLGLIRQTRDLRTSELWSWTVEQGAMTVVPFGQGAGHHDESNALQLWSTVYVGLQHGEA